MIESLLSRRTWTVSAVLCAAAALGGYLLFQQAAGALAATAVTALAISRTEDWRRRLHRPRFDPDTGLVHGYHADLSPTRIYPMRRFRPNG